MLAASTWTEIALFQGTLTLLSKAFLTGDVALGSATITVITQQADRNRTLRHHGSIDAVKTGEGRTGFTKIINGRLRESLGTAVSGSEIKLHSLSSTNADSRWGGESDLRFAPSAVNKSSTRYVSLRKQNLKPPTYAL